MKESYTQPGTTTSSTRPCDADGEGDYPADELPPPISTNDPVAPPDDDDVGG